MATTLTIVGDNQTDKVFSEIRGDVNKTAGSVDKMRDELKKTTNEAKKFKEQGKESFGSLSLQVTGFNQALQIGKMVVDQTLQAIKTLSEEGSPAFRRLDEAMDSFAASVRKLADDPGIQEWIDDLAKAVNSAKPTTDGWGESVRQWQADWATGFNVILEKIGLVEEGTARTSMQMADEGRKRREQAVGDVAAQREKLLIDDKIGDLRAKIATENEMQRMAALRDERQIRTLIEDETDAMREQERTGKATAKSREESLKRIEVLERRLVELPQERADAELKAQEEIANARHQQMEDWKKLVAESAQAAADAKRIADDERKDQSQKMIDELKAAIGEAKSILNPQQSAVDGMRDQVSRKDIAGDLIEKRKKDARDRFIGENRDKVDLDGRAIGDTSADRARNQQEINRKIRKAEADAERAFRKQAATGGLDPNEIREAQDSRILKGAEGRGLKGTKVFDALKQQLEESRKAAQEFQQQQSDIGRLQVATASPQEQRRFDAMRNKAINQAGGNSPALDDRVLQDFARSSGQGNQTLEKFATTATQALGQVTQQQAATDVRINSLEAQIAALIGAGAASSARARGQRGSRQ